MTLVTLNAHKCPPCCPSLVLQLLQWWFAGMAGHPVLLDLLETIKKNANVKLHADVVRNEPNAASVCTYTHRLLQMLAIIFPGWPTEYGYFGAHRAWRVCAGSTPASYAAFSSQGVQCRRRRQRAGFVFWLVFV